MKNPIHLFFVPSLLMYYFLAGFQVFFPEISEKKQTTSLRNR